MARRRTRRAIGAGIVLLVLTAAGAHAVPRVGSSRPTPRSTSNPAGPDVLRWPPAAAPQLENRPGSPWRAAPLLVSGAAAYVDGEYLYQGYLYDDHGAAGTPDPGDMKLQKFLFAPKAGTLTYPTAKAFANNAADLLELRVRPLPTSTALRLTLNTLADPESTAFTVAIGSSSGARPWPASAGATSPAELFLTVHGTTATLVDGATGAPVPPAPHVVVDTRRRQFEVEIPSDSWDPGTDTVRFRAGVGLWDKAAGRYLAPKPVADETSPGGAAPSSAALFDTAFRFAEPMPDWSRMGLATTMADAAVVAQADQHCFWRDCAQADALRLGDMSGLYADVDFGKLADEITDTSQVPRSGSINRILASHFSFGDGMDNAKWCGRFPITCTGAFVGNLQPYNLYVPDRPRPRGGWGLTLQLHPASGNHNEYMGSRYQSQIGERGAGSLVLTPLARDAHGDYTDATEADVFEAWADVARHYGVDSSRAALTGYSMGGGGTYKLMERWPDLFARGFGIAAVPYDDGFQGQSITSMRNVPLLVWISMGDEGSPVTFQRDQMAALNKHGVRYMFRQFPYGDHVTLATNDEYGPAADWLGDHKVVRDPPRITFAVDRRNDFAATGVVADHAYWLSAMKLRSPDVPAGIVDARSEGFGLAEPAVVAPTAVPAPGVLPGGYHGPMAHVDTVQDWAVPQRVPAVDRLQITVTNLSTMTIDARRARISCNATLVVTTDGPLQVVVRGCGSTVRFEAGTTAVSLAD